ncbi:MAG: outer membrane lipoprotein chaperone LolA [Vicinamibacteraceae bacterium]
MFSLLFAGLISLAMTIAVATSVPAAAGGQADAESLARQVQAHYDGVRDFTADFEQAYRGGVLRQRTVERGRVSIKKPGRMRWEYTDPERKLFVSDGSQMYSYVPADHQVMVQALPSGDRASTPVLFLSGHGSLLRDFTVATPSDGSWPLGTRALKLMPKKPESEYAWLVLVVDAKSLALRQLMTRDAQGGTSTFTFTNLRENVGLADDRFAFEIPRGADVIRQG